MPKHELEALFGTSHFRVLIGREELGFAEVTRLASVTDLEVPADERRNSYETVVLRRALGRDTALYDWRRSIVDGKNDRRQVTIHQLEGPGGRIKELEMAVLRDRPYAQFNFLVDLGTGDTDGPRSGFQECSQIGMSVDVIEYRNGNEKANEVRKLTGLARYPDVTLRRGIIGSLDLYQWLDQIRNGDANAIRNVTIQLQNEDHTQVVQTWHLRGARIIKHVSGPLNAQGCDVAIEELTLAYERLELE